MTERPTTEIDFARLVREIDDAYLFECDNGDKVWVPKSAITHLELSPEFTTCTLYTWFARQQNLI